MWSHLCTLWSHWGEGTWLQEGSHWVIISGQSSRLRVQWIQEVLIVTYNWVATWRRVALLMQKYVPNRLLYFRHIFWHLEHWMYIACLVPLADNHTDFMDLLVMSTAEYLISALIPNASDVIPLTGYHETLLISKWLYIILYLDRIHRWEGTRQYQNPRDRLQQCSSTWQCISLCHCSILVL